jgi:uncharacterized protein (TIGR02231 family)
MKIAFMGALVVSANLLSLSVTAADFTMDTPISEVTVFRSEGAMVTRKATFSFPVGQHQILLTNLPDEILDEENIQVSFNNNNVLLRNLKLHEIYTENAAAPRQANLKKQREALLTERAQVNDSINTRKMQLEFIKSLNQNHENSPSLQIENWDQALAFIGTKTSAIFADLQSFQKELQIINRQVKALDREIRASGPTTEDYVNATLSLESLKAVEVTVSFSYYMEDASWAPDLRATLDTSNSQLDIFSGATISQQTGEEWQDVQLTLSGTEPSDNIGSIAKFSRILTLQDKNNDRHRLRKASIDSFAPEPAPNPAFEEIVVSSNRIDDRSSGFDQAIQLKGSRNIPSTADVERVDLATITASVNLVARARPSFSTAAYLYADTELEKMAPIRDSEITLRRDGHYVGKGFWPDLETNQVLQLPYGKDDAIKVTFQKEAPEDGESGLFNRKNVEEQRYLITVINNHALPFPVEVYDNIPVAGHEDISVKLLDGATPATEENIDKNQGLLMWRKTLKPGEEWIIRHRYRVTYPTDKILTADQ